VEKVKPEQILISIFFFFKENIDKYLINISGKEEDISVLQQT